MSQFLVKQIPTKIPKLGIVGEAPGGDEWRSAVKAKDGIGQPFIGVEGQHLKRLVRKAGIAWGELPVTNTVHKQPYRNKYDTLKKEDLAFGREELIRDLVSWKAQGLNVVVACGAHALKLLTDKTGIYKYRGTVLPCTLVDGLKVFPTLHPGGLQPRFGPDVGKAEPIVILDLKKALKEAQTRELRYPYRNIKIVRDIVEARALLVELAQRATPMVVDIESIKRSGFMTAFGIATSKEDAYVFPKELLRDPGTLKLIAAFAASQVPKIFHNGCFDVFHGAYYWKILYRNIYFDTMLAQHACYANLAKLLKPNSLAFCSSMYTNEPYWKDESDEAFEMKTVLAGKVDWDKLYNYNGKDCCLTYEIFEALQGELTGWDTWDVFKADMKLIPIVLFGMMKGILIDKKRVLEYEKTNELAIKVLDRIRTKVLGDINVNSHVQVKKLIYEQWGLPKQYKSGKVTVEAKKMKKLMRFNTPYKKHLSLIMAVKKYLKNRDFYHIVTDADGCVRPSAKIHGTYTGRWSYSKGTTGSGSNEQNRPGEIRFVYVARPGKIFIQMDLSQAEARIVAALCRDLAWLRSFDAGDQHQVVANFCHTTRDKGKRIAHATHYLLGPGLLSDILGCGIKQAKEYKAKYIRLRPKLKDWHNYVNTVTRKKRAIRTCYGRVIQFFGPNFGAMLTDAVAAEPQSTSVSYLNQGLTRCYEEIPEFEFNQQGHDSFLYEVPDNPDCVEDVINRTKELVEHEIEVKGVKLTIPCDFEVGYSWGKAKKTPEAYKDHCLMEVKDLTKIREVYDKVASCKLQLA